MGAAGAPLVQAVAQQLKHANGDRVTWAGAALRNVGPAAAEEFAGLPVFTRQRGSAVLKSLGAQAAPIAGEIRNIVQDEQDSHTRRVLEALLKEVADAEAGKPDQPE